MSAIPQLISFSDFKSYKPLPNSLQTEERLMVCIARAQDIDLRDLLGRPLYKLVLDNRDTTPYLELIQGEAYEFQDNQIDYYGLVPYLVYSAYGYLLREMQATMTLSGAKIKSATESETPDQTWFDRELQEVRTQRAVWEGDIRDYINTNIALFPTYSASTARVQGSVNISNIQQPQFLNSK